MAIDLQQFLFLFLIENIISKGISEDPVVKSNQEINQPNLRS